MVNNVLMKEARTLEYLYDVVCLTFIVCTAFLGKEFFPLVVTIFPHIFLLITVPTSLCSFS